MGQRHLSQRLGVLAEALVATRLEALGWQVLGRNLRAGGHELDLVVVRAGQLRFVEVKARVDAQVDALDAITPEKIRRIGQAAEAWLADNQVECEEVAVLVAAVDCTTQPWQIAWHDDPFDVR